MPTPKGKKKRGDGHVVDTRVGSSTMGIGGGTLSSRGDRRGDQKKMGSRVSLEEQVAQAREALIEERQQELDAIVDKHDDLIREAFHMEKFVTLLYYDPKEAKQDQSAVFHEYKAPNDLVAQHAAESSSARTTRRAHNQRLVSLTTLASSRGGPSATNIASSTSNATPRKQKTSMAPPSSHRKTSGAVDFSVSPTLSSSLRRSRRTDASVTAPLPTPTKGKGKQRAIDNEFNVDYSISSAGMHRAGPSRLRSRANGRVFSESISSSGVLGMSDRRRKLLEKTAPTEELPRKRRKTYHAESSGFAEPNQSPSRPATRSHVTRATSSYVTRNSKNKGAIAPGKHPTQNITPRTPTRSQVRRIKLIVRTPPPLYSHPGHRPAAPQFGKSLETFLDSYHELDGTRYTLEDLERIANEEASLRDRIDAFRAEGRLQLEPDLALHLLSTLGHKDKDRDRIRIHQPHLLSATPHPDVTAAKNHWSAVLEGVGTRTKQIWSQRGSIVAAQIAGKVKAYWDGVAVKEDKARMGEEKRLRALAKATLKLVRDEWKKAVYHVRQEERLVIEAEEKKRSHLQLSAILDQSGKLLEAQHTDFIKDRSRSRSASASTGLHYWDDDGTHTSSDDEEDEDEEDDGAGDSDQSEIEGVEGLSKLANADNIGEGDMSFAVTEVLDEDEDEPGQALDLREYADQRGDDVTETSESAAAELPFVAETPEASVNGDRTSEDDDDDDDGLRAERLLGLPDFGGDHDMDVDLTTDVESVAPSAISAALGHRLPDRNGATKDVHAPSTNGTGKLSISVAKAQLMKNGWSVKSSGCTTPSAMTEDAESDLENGSRFSSFKQIRKPATNGHKAISKLQDTIKDTKSTSPATALSASEEVPESPQSEFQRSTTAEVEQTTDMLPSPPEAQPSREDTPSESNQLEGVNKEDQVDDDGEMPAVQSDPEPANHEEEEGKEEEEEEEEDPEPVEADVSDWKPPPYLRRFAVARVDWDPASKILPPKLLRGNLRPYQQTGLEWLASLHNNDVNGILADEMGLGKTIQTISLLAHLAIDRGIWGPHLIIVPTSVLLNWEMEFKKFLPGFRTVSYHGSTKRRRELRQGWNNPFTFNACITSYTLASRDAHIFRRKAWYYMILDEAHMIKNFRSQRWNILLMFRSFRRLLLTGTPLQNNLSELWSLLKFLMFGTKFANLKDFDEWFSKPLESAIEQGRVMDQELQAQVTKLHSFLRPYILRRLKRDVEKELPSKFEHLVICRLSKRQRFLYDEFMSRAETRHDLQSGVYQRIANIMMQLRKVCNHPDLFEVRPIVTSFVMQKSAIADYEIKELLVRRELLRGKDAHSHLNLDLLGLRFTHRCGQSVVAALHSQALEEDLSQHATGPLGEPPPLDLRTIAGFRKYSEYKRKSDAFARLRHWMNLNHLRCNTFPPYSEETLKIVRTAYTPILPWAITEHSFLLRKQNTRTASSMVKSPVDRAEEMSVIIEKFAFMTPPAVAKDLPRLALAGLSEEAISLASDPQLSACLHQSSVKLQIAFPDASLLQYDCGKLQELARLLRKRKDGGHRVLIFTQMTRILDILETFMNYHGHLYLRLDGATKIEDRQFITERFNADSRIFAFISSSRSGGVGINLTGADTVIFYDSDFNPQMDKQCEDRAHRIGQIRDVHIYRFVSAHTVEEALLRKANQKRSLDNIVIQQGEFDWRSVLMPKTTAGSPVGPAGGAADLVGMMNEAMLPSQLEKAMEEFEDVEDVHAARVAAREEDMLAGEEKAEFAEADASAGTDIAGSTEDVVNAVAEDPDPEQTPVDDKAYEELEDPERPADDEEGGTAVEYMISFVRSDLEYFREWRL